MALSQADLDRIKQLVIAYATTRQVVTATAIRQSQAEVRTFTSWYDTAAITALAEALARRSSSSQQAVASLTDAYIARVMTIMRGRPVSPAGTITIPGTFRADISPAGVYGRLADLYRWEILRGLDDAEALLTRIEAQTAVLTSTNDDLAFRAQAHHSFDKLKVAGFRRVLHPELSKFGSCGLCIVASTRIYNRDRLMPLHDRCHCGVLPVLEGDDPGDILNSQDIGALYSQAGGQTSREALKKVRVVVHDHGELGPVLRDRKDAFLDRKGAAARGRRTEQLPQLTPDQVQQQISELTHMTPADPFGRQWQTDRLTALERMATGL
ncbi:MAG: conserved hypothetical phage protein [Frankiales bacterium]|nr:conserved hypothetical phage protein [Frankiales bacterium]